MLDNIYRAEVNEIENKLRRCAEAIKYCTNSKYGEELEKEITELEYRLSEIKRIKARLYVRTR